MAKKSTHTADQVKDMSPEDRRRHGYPPAGSPADKAHQRECAALREAGVPNPVYPWRA